MRTSETINWTTSPSLKSGGNNRQLGRLTVYKSDKLTYGSDIFVVGVHVKSGISVNTSVKVGMEQAIDSIKVVGFVDKNNKAKLLTELPANFNKNSYYMVYEEYDQNGCKLDVEDFAASDVTFVSDNPMLMSVKGDVNQTFTIDGETYQGVAVEPGMYVDKGGEVNVTVIANKTGTKTTQNIVIGTPGLLSSLELQAPSETVADGDFNVKIPYVALDTEGKEITNYETIVRSSNKLSLSASDDTTLVIKQEDDGTAGIYWSDDMTKYFPGKAGAYGQSGVSNEIDRPISLTTVVVGGKSSNLMMSVADIRIPTTIADVKLSTEDDFIIKGRTNVNSTIGAVSDKLTFKDQYGKTMSPNAAKAFFSYASANSFGSSSDRGTYGIHVENKNTTLINKAADTYSLAGLSIASSDINLTAPSGKDIATFKVSIYKQNSSGDKNDISKIVTKNYDVIDISKFSNYQIDGANATMYLPTNYSADKNGKDAVAAGKKATTPLDSDTDIRSSIVKPDDYITTANDSFKVKATCGNHTVAFGYDDLAQTQNGVNDKGDPKYIADQRNTTGYAFLGDNGAIKVIDVNTAKISDASGNQVRPAITYGDMYDFDTTNYVRTGAKSSLMVNVYGTLVSKKIALSDEAPKVTTVKFMQNYGDTTSTTVNPYVTEIAAGARISPFVNDVYHDWDGAASPREVDNFGYKNAEWGGLAGTTNFIKLSDSSYGYTGVHLAILDQYGRTISPTSIKYTINNVKENTGEGAHKTESFVVSNNGSKTPEITGAEYGDTFDIKVDVNDGDFTSNLAVTVKSDLAAFISDAGDASDKQITTKLGIDK